MNWPERLGFLSVRTAKEAVAMDRAARAVEKRMVNTKNEKRLAPGRRENCDRREGELRTGVLALLGDRFYIPWVSDPPASRFTSNPFMTSTSK